MQRLLWALALDPHPELFFIPTKNCPLEEKGDTCSPDSACGTASRHSEAARRLPRLLRDPQLAQRPKNVVAPASEPLGETISATNLCASCNLLAVVASEILLSQAGDGNAGPQRPLLQLLKFFIESQAGLLVDGVLPVIGGGHMEVELESVANPCTSKGAQTEPAEGHESSDAFRCQLVSKDPTLEKQGVRIDVDAVDGDGVGSCLVSSSSTRRLSQANSRTKLSSTFNPAIAGTWPFNLGAIGFALSALLRNSAGVKTDCVACAEHARHRLFGPEAVLTCGGWVVGLILRLRGRPGEGGWACKLPSLERDRGEAGNRPAHGKKSKRFLEGGGWLLAAFTPRPGEQDRPLQDRLDRSVLHRPRRSPRRSPLDARSDPELSFSFSSPYERLRPSPPLKNHGSH